MEIEFKLSKNKKKVTILSIEKNGKKQEIGHIFTPGGTPENRTNAIQICGFDEAFEFWGCGIYGDKKNNKMKKDIQLLFSHYTPMTYGESKEIIIGEKTIKLSKEGRKLWGIKEYTEKITKNRFDICSKDACMRCFNIPCTCDIKTKGKDPYVVKTAKDVEDMLEIKKE